MAYRDNKMTAWARKIEQQDYTVNNQEAAENKNFLEKAVPLLEQLEKMENNPTPCLDHDDKDILRKCIHMLKVGMVPQSLLRIDNSAELKRMKQLHKMLGSK